MLIFFFGVGVGVVVVGGGGGGGGATIVVKALSLWSSVLMCDFNHWHLKEP